MYGHWERKLMVVCLKLFVALGLDCSTTRPSLSGIASKDLDPTAASHCVSLSTLYSSPVTLTPALIAIRIITALQSRIFGGTTIAPNSALEYILDRKP